MKTIICFVLLSLVAIVLSADSTLGKPKEDSTTSLLNSLTSFEKELENQNKFFKAIAAKKNSKLSKLQKVAMSKNAPPKPTEEQIKQQALKFLNELHSENSNRHSFGHHSKCGRFTKKSIRFNRKLVGDIRTLRRMLLNCRRHGITAEQLKRQIRREIERLRKLIKSGCPAAVKSANSVRADLKRDIRSLRRRLHPKRYFKPNKNNLIVQTKEQIKKMKIYARNFRKLVLHKKNFHLRLFKHSKHGLVKMSPMKLVGKKHKKKAQKLRKVLKRTVNNLRKIMLVAPKQLKGYIKRVVKRENKRYRSSFHKAIRRH
eukprot:gene2662-3858_t